MCTLTKCITKVDEITIDYVENLDLVTPMYNLIEYSSNYSKQAEKCNDCCVIKIFNRFWRSLEMQLINCEVELKLKWSKYCVLSAAGVDNVNGNANDNIIFTIKDTKLYVPVVTLSARDNQKLSKLLSKEFERSVYWNEYKTKSENKATTNEYRYFLKSNFVGVNRLFVLVYLNRDDDVK